MTKNSNPYPALARAQKWLAEHGEPLPEPETRSRQRARGKSRSGSNPQLATASPALGLSRHERRCTICQHPERDAIEEAFLSWRNVNRITDEFKLPGRTAVYRHAHAFGLFPQRSRNLRFALGLIIEKAEWVNPTAEGIVSAVRAFTRVTDAGEWIEPPSHVIVTSGSRMPERSALAAVTTAEAAAKVLAPAPQESLVLTATHSRTENDSTR